MPLEQCFTCLRSEESKKNTENQLQSSAAEGDFVMVGTLRWANSLEQRGQMPAICWVSMGFEGEREEEESSGPLLDTPQSS